MVASRGSPWRSASSSRVSALRFLTDGIEEAPEFGGAMPPEAAAEHVAGGNIENDEQLRRAMALVVGAAPLLAGRERQQRLGAIAIIRSCLRRHNEERPLPRGSPPPPRRVRQESSSTGHDYGPATISAFSALAGSAIGALASLATTWLTQQHQDHRQRLEQEASRRERF